MTATIISIRKEQGVAGQYGYTARVQYPDEPETSVTFVGSTYGGPIVMTTPGNPRGTFVREPERFGGRLSEAWVRAFIEGA